MDIAGTKKRIQRATKVAEESYKKMNEMLERMQRMQEDIETTSEQVDRIEYDVARQRALIEAIADKQGIDTEEILAAADLPEPPESLTETETEAESEDDDGEDLSKKATSRPSASADSS